MDEDRKDDKKPQFFRLTLMASATVSFDATVSALDVGKARRKLVRWLEEGRSKNIEHSIVEPPQIRRDFWIEDIEQEDTSPAHQCKKCQSAKASWEINRETNLCYECLPAFGIIGGD